MPEMKDFEQDKIEKKILKEQEDIRLRWDETKIELTGTRDGLKDLTISLNEAAKAGADRPTIDAILDKWQEYSNRVTELEKEMLHLGSGAGEKDPFRSFVKKSRENVEKGAKILGKKVKSLVDKSRFDKEGNPRSLTKSIVKAHQNVSAVFHEKQAQLLQKLAERIETRQIKKDEKLIDSWVKAVDRAESLNGSLDAKNNRIELKEKESEENIRKKAALTKEKIGIKLEKKEAQILTGEYTRGERFNGGIKMVIDAAKGSPFKDYFAEPKPDEKIMEDLDKVRRSYAQKTLTAAERTDRKLDFVSSWAKKQVTRHTKAAEQATRNARKLEREVMRNPQTKDVAELIKKNAEKAASMTAARDMVKEQAGEKGILNAQKPIDFGR